VKLVLMGNSQPRRKAAAAQRKMTQAEMLDEAKRTEKINRESLKDLERIEDEKKKVTIVKPVYALI